MSGINYPLIKTKTTAYLLIVKMFVMYESLKDMVKSRAGFTYVTPSDCKKISQDIYETTSKHVSVTTLKRFFGFAAQKYKLSAYTLTILTEYAKNHCSVVISTKINPAKGKRKDPNHIKFDLQDGNLQAGNCIFNENSGNLHQSKNRELSFDIKLTRAQVKEIAKDIDQPADNTH